MELEAKVKEHQRHQARNRKEKQVKSIQVKF